MKFSNETFKRTAVLFGAILVLCALDQWTKWLVVSHFKLFESVPVFGEWVKLTFVYNKNGAFGLAPGNYLPFLSQFPFHTVFSIVAMGLILFLYFKSLKEERASRLALMLIMGGAIGNFIDRIRLGQVVDFIDVDFPDLIIERWPVFNGADSFITVGVAILVILSFRSKKNVPAPAANSHTG